MADGLAGALPAWDCPKCGGHVRYMDGHRCMTFGSLFSGIGGIDLGLVNAGMRLLWHSEIDPYAYKVLKKQWPQVPNLGDVTTIEWNEVERPDLVCGGFPCQDISRAGRRSGIDGDKSGLWRHMHAAIDALRPEYVLIENSTSLTRHGLGRVLTDLASSGFDAEWDCLPAYAFGAPHIRDRIYLLAYPSGRRHGTPNETVFAGWTSSQLHGGWSAEPRVDRVADGVPDRVDRVRCLGNAVVPRIAEFIGRRLMEVS